MTGDDPTRAVKRCKGFTLLELVIVIGVIAMLSSVLLPSLSRAEQYARSIQCLNNLRVMSLAAQTYAVSNDDMYPLAHSTIRIERVRYVYAWDFTQIKDWNTGEVRVEPGLLWEGSHNPKVQQCPSFKGDDTWLGDPFTGYNYNTSYIGYSQPADPAARPHPARVDQVESPQRTALFGDGQWASGANKFMRAPFQDAEHDTFVGRVGGTQGYRHLGGTNVAFCDGHSETWTQRHTEMDPQETMKVAPGTGFLSPDNSLYDLE